MVCEDISFTLVKRRIVTRFSSVIWMTAMKSDAYIGL